MTSREGREGRAGREGGEGLSLAEARRVALAAQGFAAARPAGRVDRRHLRRVLGRMGLLQIDAVNVLVRSHELPLFARLGPHPRDLVASALRAAELFEYWVHEASFVLAADYPLHRWRMQAPLRWPSMRRWAAEHREYTELVYRRVAEEGPLAAADLAMRVRPKEPWWDWDDGKTALEVLFHSGRLLAVRRARDFARLYDLPERILPPSIVQAPALSEATARKELLVRAAAHLGVGTLADLADYHRQGLTDCRVPLAELVEEGRLLPVAVESWQRPAYMHPDAAHPRRVRARALLSPFDPVVWNRERAALLFGFQYRIEIYTPAAKRTYGYYVLPFLLGESLVGRVDLKADRAAGALRVQAAWIEAGHDPAEVAGELMAELGELAGWLGLERILVTGRGDLAPALARMQTPG